MDIFCKCNLALCGRTTVCRSTVGCFQELPSTTDLLALTDYRGRVGCLELWSSASSRLVSSYRCVPTAGASQRELFVNPSQDAASPSQFATNKATALLRCCYDDMCNHADVQSIGERRPPTEIESDFYDDQFWSYEENTRRNQEIDLTNLNHNGDHSNFLISEFDGTDKTPIDLNAASVWLNATLIGLVILAVVLLVAVFIIARRLLQSTRRRGQNSATVADGGRVALLLPTPPARLQRIVDARMKQRQQDELHRYEAYGFNEHTAPVTIRDL